MRSIFSIHPTCGRWELQPSPGGWSGLMWTPPRGTCFSTVDGQAILHQLVTLGVLMKHCKCWDNGMNIERH